MRLIVGMSGASGLIYGIRFLEVLRPVADVETHLVMSTAAKMNAAIETDYDVAGIEALADVVHNVKNLAANISSGSFRTAGMVVAPCSMKKLGGIVTSLSDNLLVRAADVVLKERRPLVLLVRESPMHTGHARLMYEVSQMGAILAPPTPAFYNRPKTIDDIVNHSVGRVLDMFDVDPGIVQRWDGMNAGKDNN